MDQESEIFVYQYIDKYPIYIYQKYRYFRKYHDIFHPCIWALQLLKQLRHNNSFLLEYQSHRLHKEAVQDYS